MAKKYFGTDGIRGAINSKNINGDMFFKFGLASGTYFKSQKKRIGGTVASSIYLMMQGVQILRIHDVNELQQAIKVFKKLLEN